MFPPKNLKTQALKVCMYHFVRYLLCKYLLFKCGEFSRQKTTAHKIHMRHFLFFFTDKLSVNLLVVFNYFNQ